MNKKKVIVFGRGAVFEKKSNSILQNYNIYCFLDNAVDNSEMDSEWGLPAYNPSKVVGLPEYDILCVSNSWFDMWKQLVEMGIPDNRIKFGVVIAPYQDGVEKVAFSEGQEIVTRDKRLYYWSNLTGECEITKNEDIKKIVRRVAVEKNEFLRLIEKFDNKPISRIFGAERGKAVDRYYIENFLSENSQYIKGSILEVLNNNYTLKYGGDKVAESIVSHVKGWGENTILCNFETGEGVESERYDCIICTQTLQYIYDLRSAITNIHKMLKKEGVALITVPGIKSICEYDSNNWGEYWSFTYDSLQRLCREVCDEKDIEIKQFGNVKTTTAYLYGVCVEELKQDDFVYNDPQYPFLIGARIIKR